MCGDIIGTTQIAIGIITFFVTFFAVFVSILTYTNYKTADLPRKELERLKAEMFAVRKELEEWKEFKKAIEGKTFLSV